MSESMPNALPAPSLQAKSRRPPLYSSCMARHRSVLVSLCAECAKTVEGLAQWELTPVHVADEACGRCGAAFHPDVDVSALLAEFVANRGRKGKGQIGGAA